MIFQEGIFLSVLPFLVEHLLAGQLEWAQDLIRRAQAGELTPEEQYQLSKAENILYSVCLQCNTDVVLRLNFLEKEIRL